MLVVGGSYLESCVIPDYEGLYGSGLRGVAAISEISESTNRFRSCIASNDEASIQSYSPVFDFEYEVATIPNTVQFDYFHSLSTPTYYPAEAAEYDVELGPLEDETILRYGMVEATAVVHGDKVVYDPQSADPVPFHANGSKANELAIVLNQSEGKNLTEQQTNDDILGALTSGTEGADIAVLKCGPSGTLVHYEGETHEIPVFQLDNFWPIGSGDVFSAVFAEYWAEQGYCPEDAAYEAALAAAYYCNTQVLPIPPNPLTIDEFNPKEKNPDFGDGSPSIYLAGPFFSIPQVWFVTELRAIFLDWGADVFSPYHDIGHVKNLDYNERDVAQADLAAIDECDILFALTDNLDPGTYFEIGYARNVDKPVFVYQHETEFRRHTMLRGSDCAIYTDLATAVHNIILESR